MSGDDGFLTRWARRKRGAAAPPRDPVKPDGAKPKDAADAAAPPEEALFDPASLPPIDSIGAGSDISAFLAPGVPAALTRAALRRAWSADPAIRDFIGLSENSWDFNAAGSMPGFGPISVDEVRRLLAQVTGEPQAENPAPATDAPAAASSNPAPEQKRPDHIAEIGPRDKAPVDRIDTAAQHELDEREPCPPVPRRGHGGALPQ
jgi:hypothetical protein